MRRYIIFFILLFTLHCGYSQEVSLMFTANTSVQKLSVLDGTYTDVGFSPGIGIKYNNLALVCSYDFDRYIWHFTAQLYIPLYGRVKGKSLWRRSRKRLF